MKAHRADHSPSVQPSYDPYHKSVAMYLNPHLTMSSDEDDFSDSMNDLFDEEDDEDSDTSSEETSE